MPEAGNIEWASLFSADIWFIIYALFYCATIFSLLITGKALFTKKINKTHLLLGVVFLIVPSWVAITFTTYSLVHHKDGYIVLIFGYFWIGILINLVSSINLTIYFFLKRQSQT